MSISTQEFYNRFAPIKEGKNEYGLPYLNEKYFSLIPDGLLTLSEGVHLYVPPHWTAKYLCTQEEWEKIAELPSFKIDLNKNPSYFTLDKVIEKDQALVERAKKNHYNSAELPVDSVNRYEVEEAVERLARNFESPYRLSHEFIWLYDAKGLRGEYGAVVGPTFNFSPETANYANENSLGMTSPVGAFPSNPFGLYDLIGNTWEWQENVYQDLKRVVIDYEGEMRSKFPDYDQRKQHFLNLAKQKGII